MVRTEPRLWQDVSCRLELGRDSYIITGSHEVRFYLKQNETYEVDL